MKRPSIWIVLEVSGDRYHLWNVEPVAWFFDEREADKWVEEQHSGKYAVKECPGVTK